MNATQKKSSTELNRKAWKRAIQDVVAQVGEIALTALVFSLMALCFLVAYHLVMGFFNFYQVVSAPFFWSALLLIGLFVWVYALKTKHLKAETGNWKKNDGTTPGYEIVNIERKDGSIAWRVDPKCLDWSLDTKNPIVEYMRARRK